MFKAEYCTHCDVQGWILHTLWYSRLNTAYTVIFTTGWILHTLWCSRLNTACTVVFKAEYCIHCGIQGWILHTLWCSRLNTAHTVMFKAEYCTHFGVQGWILHTLWCSRQAEYCTHCVMFQAGWILHALWCSRLAIYCTAYTAWSGCIGISTGCIGFAYTVSANRRCSTSETGWTLHTLRQSNKTLKGDWILLTLHKTSKSCKTGWICIACTASINQQASVTIGCIYYLTNQPSMGFSISFESCFTSTETVQTIRDGEPRTATWTFTQLLRSATQRVQCCFTSTETHRDRTDYSGWGAQDGHLDFHTAPELWEFNIRSRSLLLYVPRDGHTRQSISTGKTPNKHNSKGLSGLR